MRRLVIIVAIMPLLGCSKFPDSTSADKTQEKLPTQTISEGKIDVVKEGRLQYVIQAGRIRSFEKEKLTLLDSGVVVDFYNQAGKHTSVLNSHRARMEENRHIFLAQDSVIVRTDSGSLLRTERLYWDETKRKIRSDTLVTMITPLDSLCGYDFEANENLGSWQLRQPTGLTLRNIKP